MWLDLKKDGIKLNGLFQPCAGLYTPPAIAVVEAIGGDHRGYKPPSL